MEKQTHHPPHLFSKNPPSNDSNFVAPDSPTRPQPSCGIDLREMALRQMSSDQNPRSERDMELTESWWVNHWILKFSMANWVVFVTYPKRSQRFFSSLLKWEICVFSQTGMNIRHCVYS